MGLGLDVQVAALRLCFETFANHLKYFKGFQVASIGDIVHNDAWIEQNSWLSPKFLIFLEYFVAEGLFLFSSGIVFVGGAEEAALYLIIDGIGIDSNCLHWLIRTILNILPLAFLIVSFNIFPPQFRIFIHYYFLFQLLLHDNSAKPFDHVSIEPSIDAEIFIIEAVGFRAIRAIICGVVNW